jgi:hypothetical protein
MRAGRYPGAIDAAKCQAVRLAGLRESRRHPVTTEQNMARFIHCCCWFPLLGLSLVPVNMSVAQSPAAGIQASTVTVSPRSTPDLPEGNAGIAAKYPGDIGIEKDPDVIFVESFEDSVDELGGRWESVAGQPIMSKSDDVVSGSGGRQSLLLTRVAGGTKGYLDGGSLYRRLSNPQGGHGYEQVFFRCYMKFNEGHAPIHHYGTGLAGFHPATPWPQGGAGERPQGNARWSTQIEPGNFGSWSFYSYWQNMGGSPPRGQTWGNTFESGALPRSVAREKWICLEVMVKLNDIGDSNGEQAYWLDGKLSRTRDGRITSYLGKGFPASGTWLFDKGKGVALDGGRPFPGFEWRSIPELKINAIWLYRYMSRPERGVSKVWWDHVVVAKKYVGPLTALRGGSRPQAPGPR